jgi:hypothetical protein
MGVSATDRSYDNLAAALRTGSADAVARLRDVVTARHGEAGDHARWGRLCEQAGEAGLALTEYQQEEDTVRIYTLCERCVASVDIVGTGGYIERAGASERDGTASRLRTERGRRAYRGVLRSNTRDLLIRSSTRRPDSNRITPPIAIPHPSTLPARLSFCPLGGAVRLCPCPGESLRLPEKGGRHDHV